jgi:hypothetical protein
MRTMRHESDGGLRERPMGDLLHDFAEQGQGLLRDELRIAKAEIREEAKTAAKGGAAMGAGGAVLYAAVLLLGATLVLIGSTFMPAWAAALIVTALYAVGGFAALSYGKKELSHTDPKRAVQQIQEDGRWAKETMRDVMSHRSANA